MKDAAKAIRDLQNFIQNESKKLIKQMVDNTANDAKTLAPSGIASTITTSEIENGARIEVNHPQAAYVEFGTGDKVFNQFTPNDSGDEGEYRKYAKEFYISGKGKMPQQPYLFPVLFRDRDMFVQELIKALEKEYAK